MEDFFNSYIQIIFSSAIVYIFVIVAIRLFGKKELSQLSVVDLVFVLLISNSVQNAMVGSNSTLSGGLVAASTLFLVNFIIKQFMHRFPGFSKLIQGETLMLIYDGRLDLKNVARSELSMDEIMEALREHGVSRIEDVNLAVLEVDGNVSVLTDNYKKKTTRKRKGRQGDSRKQS